MTTPTPADARYTLDLDHTMRQFEFDAACEQLADELDRLNQHGDTYVSRGRNVGWRNQSGTCEVTLADGVELVRGVTPNGPWSMEVTVYDEKLVVTVSHHDSSGDKHTLTAPTAEATTESRR